MNTHLWIGFTGGLLAFAHCLGMCGGFVLYLSHRPGSTALARHLLWQAGRVTTYLFLGALAGYSGHLLKGLLQFTWLQNAFSYLSGAVIIVMGLAVLGLIPVGKYADNSDSGLLTAIFGQSLFIRPSSASAIVLGMATGCLPCPIVIAFLAYAVQTESVTGGMSVMAGLGLGTVVPLLLLGAFSSTFSRWSRRWGRWTGGTILVLLGLLTMLRGSSAFHHLLGCPGHAGGSQCVLPCCEEQSDVRNGSR